MKIKGYKEFLLLEKVDSNKFDRYFDKIQSVEEITGPFIDRKSNV